MGPVRPDEEQRLDAPRSDAEADRPRPARRRQDRAPIGADRLTSDGDGADGDGAVGDGDPPVIDFQALVEGVTDVVQLLDGSGVTQYVTPSAAAMFDCPPSQLVGRDFPRLVYAADRVVVASAIERAVHGPADSLTEVEFRLRRRDGELRWIQGYLLNRLDAPRVGAVVAQWRDVTVTNEARSQLRHAATHDPLTDLANRVLLTDHVELALAAAARHPGTVAAMLLCDLDEFKAVNDTLGHAAGDDILRQVAERLRLSVRPLDTVARLGGDEFAILCPDINDPLAVAGIARRVQEAVSAPYPVDGQATEVRISASVGVGITRPGSTPVDLLRDADAALYEAKRHGRNRVEVFDDLLSEAIADRQRLQIELRRDIESGNLELRFQPLRSVSEDRVVGVEALVRWPHAKRGLLGPDAFLPLAEDTGLIVPLGQWVLDAALAQAARWQQDDRGLRVSVNVSPRELKQQSFVGGVAELLHRHDVDPSSICIEVTEVAAVEDLDATSATLARLRSLGIHVSLDDFGTGYSSLTWLQQLPVDTLKLDRTFVRGLVDHPASDQIVAALLALARALGLETVGEGVETQGQLDRLVELGCDEVQGFLIGRPVPADQI